MNKSIQQHVLEMSSYFLSLILFLYVVLTHVIKIITPQQTYIDPRVFDLSYVKLLLSVGFLLVFLGVIDKILRHELSFIPITSIRWKDRIIYITTSLFFAYFYAGNNSPLKNSDILSLIVSLIFFIIFLPSIIQFYSEYKIPNYKLLLQNIKNLNNNNVINKNIVIYNKNIQLVFILRIIILLSSFFIVFSFIISYLNGQTTHEKKIRQSFYIRTIIPQKVIPAQPAVLKGYNFDVGGDPTLYRIMTGKGQVSDIIKWDKNSIEFTIPLFLKNGNNTIWIEKPVENRGKIQIIKSNTVHFTVLPRFAFNPTATDGLIIKIVKRIKKIILYNNPNLSIYLF